MKSTSSKRQQQEHEIKGEGRIGDVGWLIRNGSRSYPLLPCGIVDLGGPPFLLSPLEPLALTYKLIFLRSFELSGYSESNLSILFSIYFLICVIIRTQYGAYLKQGTFTGEVEHNPAK
jgi:hypothetical protein